MHKLVTLWLMFYSLKMTTKGVIWNSNICSRLRKAANPIIDTLFFMHDSIFLSEVLDSILNIFNDDVTLFINTQKRMVPVCDGLL